MVAHAGPARHLVVLINEIDVLSKYDPPSIATLRGYNDAKRATFVMTGHSVIRALKKHDSPWFHFTDGPDFDGAAVFLRSLDPSPAKRLVAQLTRSPLALRWANPDDRRRATALLLDRSECIPWLLQRYLHDLVIRMESVQRDVIGLPDVEVMFQQASRHELWDFFDSIDYRQIWLEGDENNRPAARLVLFAMARARYFTGEDPAIDDPGLTDRNPATRSFTCEDMRAVALATAAEFAGAGTVRALREMA